MISTGILLIRIFLLSLVSQCSAHDALQTLHRRELTKELRDKLLAYDSAHLECMQNCTVDAMFSNHTYYSPLCIFTNATWVEDDTSEAFINAQSCSCTDKPYVAQKFSCVLRECAKNSSDIETILGGHYSMCMDFADIVYPKPEIFFNELCLLDDYPEGLGAVPTDVPTVKDVWTDYSFAEKWPEKTATTWTPSPSGTPVDLRDYLPEEFDTDPNWTCVPSPLPETVEKEDTGNENTGNGTSGRKGTEGLIAMAAVVAVLTGVVIFL